MMMGASSGRLDAPSSSTATPAVATNAEEAKDNLRRALEASGGSTLGDEVQAAAEVLSNFNPTPSPARAWPLNSGSWTSLGQDFKGTTRTADGVECTLGRLAFNIFEPVDFPVLITDTVNVVGPREKNAAPEEETLYKFCTHWVARDGSGLKGFVEARGSCSEDLSKPDRLRVKFTYGFIEPGEGQDLDAWRKVIGLQSPKGADNDASGEEEDSPLAERKAKQLMLKEKFGFEGPAGSLGPRGELSYQMKRAPSGSLDILYIDDEMRVSRGSSEGLVVVTRD